LRIHLQLPSRDSTANLHPSSMGRFVGHKSDAACAASFRVRVSVRERAAGRRVADVQSRSSTRRTTLRHPQASRPVRSRPAKRLLRMPGRVFGTHRPPEGPAPTDARTQTRSDRPRGRARSRAHAEHPARSLRTRRRSPASSPSRSRVQRARPNYLNGHRQRRVPARHGPSQRNRAGSLTGSLRTTPSNTRDDQALPFSTGFSQVNNAPVFGRRLHVDVPTVADRMSTRPSRIGEERREALHPPGTP
jgi:hypothetical protein